MERSRIRHAVISPQYLWVAGIAIAVRVIWAILVPVVPVSDSAAYDTFAQNLAFCQNYGWNCTDPSAYWPVGTSFAYSVLYRIFGHTYEPVVFFNIIVGVTIVVLSQYLAERWFGAKAGIIAGLMLALWACQVQFTTTVNSELLFTALWLGALTLWCHTTIPFLLRTVGTGVILAGACYVKPVALLIPFLMMLVNYVRVREVWKNLAATAIMMVTIGLLIAPWSMRNTQAFGHFVLISTNGGANLWMGNNPESQGGYMPLPPDIEQMNEALRDDHLKSLAIAHIKDRPVLFVKRLGKRLIDTHARETIGVSWNETQIVERYGKTVLLLIKLTTQVYWLVMLGLGLVGAVMLIRQQGWLFALFHPTILFWGYFAAIHAVIVSGDRYHLPSVPMIGVLAVLPVVALWERFESEPNRRSAQTSAQTVNSSSNENSERRLRI